MPYKIKGKCIYNKETGKKIGCTDGDVQRYLRALYANVPDAKKNEIRTKLKEIFRRSFAKPGKSIVSQYEEHTNCGTPDCCGECEQTGGGDLPTVRKFSELRKEAKEKDGKDDGVETEPTLTAKHKKGALKRPNHYDYTLQGLPVTARFNAYEEKKPQEKAFMPTPRQIPAPAGGHSVPKGYKRVKDHIAGWKLVKEEDAPELTLEEAVSYHIENKISFTENVFRPGSEMFFEMISEAKKLYKEGKYTPTDEYEVDMLNSDIGEIAEYEGQAVVLDYPIEEGLEECWTGYTQRGMKKKGNKMVPNCVPVNEADDPTGGKGIGKPFRSNGGGAVYVRVGDGYEFEVSPAKKDSPLQVKRIRACDESEAIRWYVATTPSPENPGKQVDPVKHPLTAKCLDAKREDRRKQASVGCVACEGRTWNAADYGGASVGRWGRYASAWSVTKQTERMMMVRGAEWAY